jgi:hypothetical protein
MNRQQRRAGAATNKRKGNVRLDSTPYPVGCICNDCGVDCAKIGEYYMASPEIWERTLHLGWSDNLCIGCLEQRLGRRITPGDFCRRPNSPWEFSLRLSARVFGSAITKHKPYRLRKGSNGSVNRATCKRIAEFLKSEPPLRSAKPAP